MDRVTCVSCGRPFDPAKSAECSCLQPMRSFRCPHCASCFCRDKKLLERFWREAPAELIQRRRVPVPAPAANVRVEEVKRPLVLFADDDPTGRAIASRVIDSLGCGVIVAKDGEEALSLAREYRPDLIITDALMPRLDGREMGRLVKNELPRTKVVVITSVYKDARYKSEAFKEFAVDEYLAKPVAPAALRDLIAKHL